MGKIVIVAALDATFERKPFGNICQLVPLAENIHKLSAVCLSCSEEAFFTYKHSHQTGEVNDIGGIDKYIPVCRKCFMELSSNKRTFLPRSEIKQESTEASLQPGSELETPKETKVDMHEVSRSTGPGSPKSERSISTSA